MSHNFISYSRKDIGIAQKIVDALAANNLDIWIDWKSIPRGEDWMHEIYRGIEEADAFIFLISPDSVASEICNMEIAHAVKNGKRILPIFIANVDDKGFDNVTNEFLFKEQKEEICRRNFIKCRENKDNFDEAIDEIRTTINTDYEWLKFQTELQVKALKWEEKKDASRLLRGAELREAEQQLASAGQKDPQPTDLQRLYVLEGRHSETRTRNIVLTLVIAVFIVLGILSLIANQQRNVAVANANIAVTNANIAATSQVNAENQKATAQANALEAQRQSEISHVGELAAQSASLRDRDFSTSMLLGIESYRTLDSVQTRGTLLDNARSHLQLSQYLFGHTGTVASVAFSSDGKTLASGSYDNTIVLWDVATGQPIGQPLTGHTDTVNSVAFSPDGKTLASGSRDNTIILWDVATHQLLGQPLRGNTGEVNSVAFSPDGKILVSGTVGIDNGTIILWDMATRQPIGQPLTGNTSEVVSLAFSPDGETLASSSDEGAIILWDMATHQPLGQPLFAPGGANSLAFSPDGKTIASGRDDHRIILWDVATRQPIGQPLTGHTNWVHSLAFSPDGKTLASGSDDHTVILWDLTARQPIDQMLTGHTDMVLSVAFSPDGKTLASGACGKNNSADLCVQGEIKLWNVATGQPIGQPLIGHTDAVASVAFSPDGKTLASGSWDNTIILWDVATGQPIGQPLTGNIGEVHSVVFSPDGKTLASGSKGQPLILWDVATHQPIGQQFTGNTNEVNSVAFSPDGKTLASGSSDNTIILWDVATGQPIGQPLSGHTSTVTSVAFSPDGKTLASGSWDKTVILWDVNPESWIEKTCQRVGRNFTQAEWLQYFPGEAYRITCSQWPAGQ